MTERILACPSCGEMLDDVDINEDGKHIFCPVCADVFDIEDAIVEVEPSELLKPCPFCGEEVEWREDKEDIYCPCCEASWQSVHYLNEPTRETWNRRVANRE